MKQTIEFYQITPDELIENILNAVQNQINSLRADFQPKQPPQYLTRKMTAQMLSISLVTLHDWTRKGILKHYKLGNRTYYRLEDVETALSNSNRK